GPWPTLQLSVDPEEARPTAEETRPRGYDLLMHLDLTELGATWIDARIAGRQLHAVLYVESADGRQRARASLPSLEQTLQALGFDSVGLDVRSTAELPHGQAAERFHS